MNYIVLDMEWNQAMSYADMVKSPVFLTGEIIQIGAVKLDDQFQEVDCFNGRIAPQYYTELNPHVAEVTKLTTEEMRNGKPFLEVFADFCDWCGPDFAFLIWGTEDLRILRKNMDLFDIDTSFMPKCYNLQNVFVEQVTHEARACALTKALAHFKETPFDAHDALNDAKSTALLCKHLNLQTGLAEYKEIVENREGIVESFEFEEPYMDIYDALDDDFVVSFECPNCGGLVWGDNWVREKSSITRIATGTCPEGEEFFIKLKFRPIENNRVVVKRFAYALTDALREEHRQYEEQMAAWRKYVI
jgi:DNA polymerase III epsilon subunit-like protein